MSVTPVHYHKSKVYDKSNIILLLIPALIFFLVITIYLTSIQTKTNQEWVTSTSKSDILGEEDVDNSQNVYLE